MKNLKKSNFNILFITLLMVLIPTVAKGDIKNKVEDSVDKLEDVIDDLKDTYEDLEDEFDDIEYLNEDDPNYLQKSQQALRELKNAKKVMRSKAIDLLIGSVENVEDWKRVEACLKILKPELFKK